MDVAIYGKEVYGMYLANNRTHPPKLSSTVVRRQALENKLKQGLSKKVMVLVASAGSGKTTALLKVLKSISKKKLAVVDGWGRR